MLKDELRTLVKRKRRTLNESERKKADAIIADKVIKLIENAIVKNGIVKNGIVGNAIKENELVGNGVIENAIIENGVIENEIVGNEITENELIENEIVGNAITENGIVGNAITENGKRVLAYYSYNNEVDTRFLIRLLRDRGNKVYLPRVNGEILEVVEYKEDVVTDKLYEPNGQAVFPDLDVVIVPIVAYDKNKYRLGYGKGYYDRFLSTVDALKIGIAYKVQEVEDVFHETHDIKLDFIVNECETI